MGLKKRISAARERSARERAMRREERRRADRAKAGATAADRSKARMERTKAREAVERQKPEPKAKEAEARPVKAKPRTAKPKAETPKKPAAKTPAKEKSKAKVAASKPGRPAAKPPRRRPKFLRPRRSATPAKRGPALAAGAGKVGTGIRSIVAEVLKLGREMIAIPVGLWLAAAEVAGAFVLRAWRSVIRPALLWLWAAGRATMRFAERHVTPARAVAVVTLVAAGALAASQWLDYHSVSVGSDAYAGEVGAVAPAPEIETEVAGNAHSWVMVPLAALALVILIAALAGRRGFAALLIPLGIAVIAIALIVDLPKGLDEGDAAVAYEGASASLLEGFWLQIACGVVLIGCGLMLPRYLRPTPAHAEPALTGPTLFQRAAARARKLAKRRPQLKRPRRPTGGPTDRKPPRARTKRKVQGAGT